MRPGLCAIIDWTSPIGLNDRFLSMKMQYFVSISSVILLIVGAMVIMTYINTLDGRVQEPTDVSVSGKRSFTADVSRIQTRSISSEMKSIFSPKCGPAKPEHAPSECGVQQWKGYSETNPAASAWMALTNTGTTACTVTITQLVLSYLSTNSDGSAPTRTILSSAIQGVQILTDGTNGEDWGNYVRDLPPGSTFTIPANPHAYIHPFGPITAIPDNATEVTLTFSADITNGCVVSGGMDTFEENATPNTNAPYTKNGSETDFIKEAMKTPWVTKTVDFNSPVSYSITHLPRSERTGWYKGKDEVVQEVPAL